MSQYAVNVFLSSLQESAAKLYETLILHKISHLPRPQSLAVDCFGDKLGKVGDSNKNL